MHRAEFRQIRGAGKGVSRPLQTARKDGTPMTTALRQKREAASNRSKTRSNADTEYCHG